MPFLFHKISTFQIRHDSTLGQRREALGDGARNPRRWVFRWALGALSPCGIQPGALLLPTPGCHPGPGPMVHDPALWQHLPRCLPASVLLQSILHTAAGSRNTDRVTCVFTLPWLPISLSVIQDLTETSRVIWPPPHVWIDFPSFALSQSFPATWTALCVLDVPSRLLHNSRLVPCSFISPGCSFPICPPSSLPGFIYVCSDVLLSQSLR